MELFKTCTFCRKSLPIAVFARQSGTAHAHSECRACRKWRATRFRILNDFNIARLKYDDVPPYLKTNFAIRDTAANMLQGKVLKVTHKLNHCTLGYHAGDLTLERVSPDSEIIRVMVTAFNMGKTLFFSMPHDRPWKITKYITSLDLYAAEYRMTENTGKNCLQLDALQFKALQAIDMKALENQPHIVDAPQQVRDAVVISQLALAQPCPQCLAMAAQRYIALKASGKMKEIEDALAGIYRDSIAQAEREKIERGAGKPALPSRKGKKNRPREKVSTAPPNAIPGVYAPAAQGEQSSDDQGNDDGSGENQA